MLAAERKEAIRAIVEREGRVDLASLGEQFSVSEDTIRRDLRELDEAGLVRRVRGGALRRSPVPAAYRSRENLDTEAKSVIATEAAKGIRDGMVVGIDNGTSTLACARAIPTHIRFTAITTNLPAAIELGDRDSVKVIVPGGTVMSSARGLIGATTCRELSRFRLDLAIIGTCGIDPDAGLTALDFDESEVKRALANQAQQTLVLATQNKLGVAEACTFAELHSGDHIVTDAAPDHPVLEALRSLAVIVTTC